MKKILLGLCIGVALMTVVAFRRPVQDCDFSASSFPPPGIGHCDGIWNPYCLADAFYLYSQGMANAANTYCEDQDLAGYLLSLGENGCLASYDNCLNTHPTQYCSQALTDCYQEKLDLYNARMHAAADNYAADVAGVINDFYARIADCCIQQDPGPQPVPGPGPLPLPR